MSSALSSVPQDDRTGPRLNMRELAVYLRTTRQTLTAWLDKWPDFPIVSRGTNGREYVFDAQDVVDFLRAKKAEQAARAEARDQALAQLTFPFEPEDDEPLQPGLSIKDQIEAVKLRRLRREEEQAAGRLVEVAAISDVLIDCFQQLQRAMRTALRQVSREHNLPDAVTRSLETRFAEAQRAFVRGASEVMQRQPDHGHDAE